MSTNQAPADWESECEGVDCDAVTKYPNRYCWDCLTPTAVHEN